MPTAHHLHGYTCVSTTPDGCALLVPDAFAFTNDVTNVDPKSEAPGTPPLKLPTFKSANRGQPDPTSGSTKVCKRCGATQPLSAFKRTYTAAQAIHRGYGTPNPLPKRGEPMYLRIPHVEYESATCLTCQPQAPFYPNTQKGIRWALMVGALHANPQAAALMAEVKLKKLAEGAYKRRMQRNHMKEVKRRIQRFVRSALAKERESLSRRRIYINGLQSRADLPRSLWVEFIDRYTDALEWAKVVPGRDAAPVRYYEEHLRETLQEHLSRTTRRALEEHEAAALLARDVPSYALVTREMFRSHLSGRYVLDYEDRRLLPDVVQWVKCVVERAKRDEIEQPLGHNSQTKVQRFVAEMRKAIEAWNNVTAAMQRDKSPSPLLKCFLHYMD